MNAVRAFVAALACTCAATAFATPQPIDATGLWIDAGAPGWGVSVFHQGDTLFASLFVYGPDRQAKWYTASSMTGGPTVYSGALTEGTGPYFGASSFDPGAVARRVVGTMTMTLDGTGAQLAYSVDGTQVSRRVSRFSMRRLDLNGTYVGAIVQPAEVAGTEMQLTSQSFDIYDQATFAITGGNCKFDGATRSQDGETVTVSGLHGCGTYPFPIDKPWTMTVDPTPHGFTGVMSAAGMSRARMAFASRGGETGVQGSGWLNDLWFPPGEGGWGLNLIDQGDTAFATLFVYDAHNRPRWYSASQLKAGMQGFRPSWGGSLEESTGPYFGGPFDPSAVARRAVGSLSMQVTEPGDALVTYTVDGVTVVKRVSRFAFRRNNLSGSYAGGVAMLDPGTGPFLTQFTIDDQGDRVDMTLDIDPNGRCTMSGASSQYGAQRSVTGTYRCTSGAQGNFRMDDIAVTANGLTATYAGPGGFAPITRGNIAGARR